MITYSRITMSPSRIIVRFGSAKSAESRRKLRIVERQEEIDRVNDLKHSNLKRIGSKFRNPQRSLIDNRPELIWHRNRMEELDSLCEASKLPWRIGVSSVLDRYPIITRLKRDWELDFEQMLGEVSFERRKLFKAKFGDEPRFVHPNDKVFTVDDLLAESRVKLPPRDYCNMDFSDMTRMPFRNVYLMVARDRDEHKWQFPQGKLREGETCREAAERIIDRAVSLDDVGSGNRYFISNAPFAYDCYEYPKDVQETRKAFGAKIFYYRAMMLAKSYHVNRQLYTSHAWITTAEMDLIQSKELSVYMRWCLHMADRDDK